MVKFVDRKQQLSKRRVPRPTASVTSNCTTNDQATYSPRERTNQNFQIGTVELHESRTDRSPRGVIQSKLQNWNRRTPRESYWSKVQDCNSRTFCPSGRCHTATQICFQQVQISIRSPVHNVSRANGGLKVARPPSSHRMHKPLSGILLVA